LRIKEANIGVNGCDNRKIIVSFLNKRWAND